MRLIVVSGFSGSGKSVALNTLEDEDFYCIDNLPSGLLGPLVEQLATGVTTIPGERMAVGIDARSGRDDLANFAGVLDQLRGHADFSLEVVFLRTALDTLLRRFSETRRKHPLSDGGTPLIEAIGQEQTLLADISERADLTLDTSQLTLHALRSVLRERLLSSHNQGLSLLFQSFGYKNGVPLDSDFVFDVRCLANPQWEPHLRTLTGKDTAVAEYLAANPGVDAMFASICTFIDAWLPAFRAENRAYMTISIGCTGGQHRSVYLAERLAGQFQHPEQTITLRHREIHTGDRIEPPYKGNT